MQSRHQHYDWLGQIVQEIIELQLGHLRSLHQLGCKAVGMTLLGGSLLNAFNEWNLKVLIRFISDGTVMSKRESELGFLKRLL